MTRRVVWLTVLALAVLTLAGAWFLTHFEQVPVKEWTPPEAAARRNGYLALERFLTAMGRPLIREGNPKRLDDLPAGGVVILDRNRRRHMSAERVAKLLAWVDAGGYLILVPEYPRTPDPLLERLGAHWPPPKAPAANAGSQADDDEEDTPAPQPEADAEAKPACQTCKASPAEAAKTALKAPLPKSIAVVVPGASRPLDVAFQFGLDAGKSQPAWRAGDPEYGDQLLHYTRGHGQVTVAVNLDRLLFNQMIGAHDHAELLWTLLSTYRPQGQVLLMSQLAVPNLWEWLTESAPAATAAGLVLLILWLWQRLVRFGPALPEPEPTRRELSEHLAALGRYVWKAGGLSHWLQVAREEFQSRLILRHPAIASQEPAGQAAALAKMSDLPLATVAAALSGSAESPHSFTFAVRTLRHLERIL